MLQIERGTAPGSGGGRGEFLITLAQQWTDDQNARFSSFCMAFMHGETPPWSGLAMGAINTIAAYKTDEKLDDKVRPIGVMHEVKRLTEGISASQNRVIVDEYCQPEQLGCSPAGAHKLIHSVRMSYESPQGENWVAVKLDFWNAHSSVFRASVISEYKNNPSLQHMALHAGTVLAPPTLLIHRGKVWGNPAGEGVIQGNAKSSQDFNVAIQPHLVILNQEVSVGGGIARGGQDDVFVVGPSAVVFPAIDRFSEQTFQSCGLRLQRAKCLVLCNGDLPLDTPNDMNRAGDIINGTFEPGMDVYGIPVGSDAWVRNWLNIKVQNLKKLKEKTCAVLENDKQAMYNLLTQSFSHKMDYHASLCYPSDSSESLRNFDELVWSYLESATGLTLPLSDTGGRFECPLLLPINSLSGRSFQHHIARLTISKGGYGFRSVAETAGPAFVGGIEMSIPFFTGDFGLAPALEPLIGRPDHNRAGRWGPLIRNGSRTGQEFDQTWTKLVNDGSERASFLNQDLGGTILGLDSS